MHPDLLRALARQREADLLREHQFRHPDDAILRPHTVRRPTSTRRVRHRLGLMLLVVGQRLLRDGATPAELTDVRH